MRRIKTQKGFTIIETLIVLAITSIMFVATSILVSGQIQRYAYKESALNMQQRIVDVINDTRVGYFSIAEGGSGGIAPPGHCKGAGPAMGSTSAPGMSDCVYIGKKVVVTPGANPSIAVSSLISDATVTGVLAQSVNPSNSGPVLKDDVHEITSDLPYGLDYTVGGTFYVLFDRYGTSSVANSIGEGQSISIYGADGSNQFFKNPNGIVICANNGNRYASYRVGVNGSPNVELEYKKRADWGC